MSKKYKCKPKHKGYQTTVKAICDYCGIVFWESKSSYSKNRLHFHSMKCYALFKKEKQPMQEQNAYQGIRKIGESKQVYHRRYVEKHKINIAHLKARRYAKEKGALGSHTLQEWENIKKLHDYKCAYCKEKKTLTKDHIVPISKGGTDFIENIQPLCKNCNSKKHNKFPYESPELLKQQE